MFYAFSCYILDSITIYKAYSYPNCNQNKRWIRLSGKAVFCTTKDTKSKALDTMPILKNMYSVDDDIFEIFYIENAIATFCSMNGDSKTVNL